MKYLSLKYESSQRLRSLCYPSPHWSITIIVCNWPISSLQIHFLHDWPISFCIFLHDWVGFPPIKNRLSVLVENIEFPTNLTVNNKNPFRYIYKYNSFYQFCLKIQHQLNSISPKAVKAVKKSCLSFAPLTAIFTYGKTQESCVIVHPPTTINRTVLKGVWGDDWGCFFEEINFLDTMRYVRLRWQRCSSIWWWVCFCILFSSLLSFLFQWTLSICRCSEVEDT